MATGEAVRPPAPVHLRSELLAGGGLRLSWVRRSRAGWSWLDGGDAPLGEEVETYALRLSGVGFDRTVTVASAQYDYSPAEQAADGGGPLEVSVRQLGTYATSRASALTVDRP